MQENNTVFPSVTDLIQHINDELDWEEPINVPERLVLRTVRGVVTFVGYREPIIDIDPDYDW